MRRRAGTRTAPEARSGPGRSRCTALHDDVGVGNTDEIVAQHALYVLEFGAREPLVALARAHVAATVEREEQARQRGLPLGEAAVEGHEPPAGLESAPRHAEQRACCFVV